MRALEINQQLGWSERLTVEHHRTNRPWRRVRLGRWLVRSVMFATSNRFEGVAGVVGAQVLADPAAEEIVGRAT
jgi:hypothetical protein